jgi:phosphoribosylformylglycinamidine synthase subunit PurS
MTPDAQLPSPDSPLWRARILVMLKPIVNDPQGLSIRGGLRQMGYESVEAVRAGKFLELTLRAHDRAEAEQLVEEMCRRLLANPVIEDFRFTLARSRSASARRAAHAAR